MRNLLAKYFKRVNEKFIIKRKLKPVEGSSNQWFYLESKTYKGKEFQLEDGTRINKGDRIAEIHINNERVTEHLGSFRFIFKVLEEECRAIAYAINQGDYQEVVAFAGITLLYPFAEKKGFEVRPITNRIKALQLGLWESLIKYSLEKKKSKFKLRKPFEIWISKEKIQKIYLEKE